MKGIQISLTGKERERLIDAVTYYLDIMSDGYDTSQTTQNELNDGLGKAMFKLYKGYQGEEIYKVYNKK